jgi:hypothetical protein
MKLSSCGHLNGDTSVLRHTIFSEIQCFQGIHILHVTLSYFMIVLLLLLCYLITSCGYESRLGKSPIARMHSRSHVVMLGSKVTYVFAFTFFRTPTDADTWFLSLTLFIGSIFVLFSFAQLRPYYSAYASKMLNLLNGFFLWTNSVLLFSCFVGPLDFTGSLPLFVLGSPFALVIVLGMRDERKAYLMQNLNQLQKGEDYQRYINYYLTIVETKGK